MNPIRVEYSDEKLRILVEEYITIQKKEFTFKGLCSYVLYWAKEEGKTINPRVYESDQLDDFDCERLNIILMRIINEGRISVLSGDNAKYLKIMG